MSTEWTSGPDRRDLEQGWRVMVQREDGWETIYRGNSRADACAARMADGAARARIERVDAVETR